MGGSSPRKTGASLGVVLLTTGEMPGARAGLPVVGVSGVWDPSTEDPALGAQCGPISLLLH